MANKKLAVYALIIAIYTALSLLLGSFSFGLIQIRIGELLLVLCLANKRFILPITLGCLLTNTIGVLSGMNIMSLDIVVGTLATYLSGICVYAFKDIKLFNRPILSLFLPSIINAVLVGLEIHFYLSVNLVLSMVYVGLGELVSLTLLGSILYKPILKGISAYIE